MALLGVISRATSGLDHREVQDILEGNLILEHKPTSRTIRVFLSSDPSDSKCERQYLRKDVFLSLRKHCQSLGLQLHAVDLYMDVPLKPECTSAMYKLERSGVLQLALKEIKLCQCISAGPSFVTLLAQRYGHKPLHLCIPEEEFGLLCAAVEDPTARQLLQEWYKLDTNAQPPEFVLQSGEESLLDVSEDEDSLQQWISIHNSLSKAVRRAAKVALGKDPTKVQKYIMSATEEEITMGIFSAQADPNQSCFWFKRTFTDLLDQRPTDPALPTFTDMTPGRRGLEFDIETMKTLNHLKEARLPAKYVGLDATNIFESPLKWQKGKGLDPEENTSHADYLTLMCEKFTSALEDKITDAATVLELQSSNAVHQEVLCHGAYCRERTNVFVDRKGILSKVRSYLEGSSDKPLVIYGPSGSGKTSVMAATAYFLRERNPVKRMAIVVRFLGLTPGSSSIRHTLRSICEQISSVYKVKHSTIPGDYKGIAGHFEVLLQRAEEGKPLFIFLDAVDQLSPEDGASGMSWLPLSLPAHVKIVLSTSSEVHYRCFPVLQSLLSRHQENFVEVPPLTSDECREFLLQSLSSRGRQLSPQQEEVVLRTLRLCPLPLYLQFLVREVVNWKSYTSVSLETFSQPANLRGVIDHLFHETECKYGPTFVSHTLSLITAAKHGLTEPELLDMLACDVEVMKEVCQGWAPGEALLSAVPPLLWSQLFHSLSPCLEFRIGAGGAYTLRWSHRQLQEAAQQRYLGSGEAVLRSFSLLADYFSGNLAEIAAEKQRERIVKPDDESDTHPIPSVPLPIDAQPLFLNEETQLYNVRKLTELPPCLAGCGRVQELRKTLSNFHWLKACIHTTSCADVINNFAPILPVIPLGRHGKSEASDRELRLLREALSSSVEALNFDSSQLCLQLVGRLLPYLLQSQNERPLLKQLVTVALEDSTPPLTPTQPFSNIPGGPLLVSMQGHRDRVSCIATATVVGKEGKPSLCIVSSSWDKTLKSWDLDSTGVLKTFDGHTDRVLSVALTADGLYAVSGAVDTTVRHWHVPTGRCECTMKGHSGGVNAVVITTDGCKTVSGSSDTTIKLWNTDPNSSSHGKLIFTMRQHKSPVLSLTLSSDKHLASGEKSGTIFISNIVSGEVLHSLHGHRVGVSAVAFVRLQSSMYLVSGSEDGSLRAWNAESGQGLHTFIQEEASPITSIATGPNGKVVTTSMSSAACVWEVYNGTLLFQLAGHSDTVCSTSIADEGGLAITGSTDCSICIWDLQSPPVQQTTQLHSTAVHSAVISPCGTYGLSASKDCTVKIYELDCLRVVRDLEAHEGAVNDLFVLRDSRRFLTASSDKTIKLWNGENGELLQVFEGHEDSVNSVAVSSDSELIMSGGEDSKVMFWSMKTGKKLKTFTNHSVPVVCVAFSQSAAKHYMISASRDGQVCIRDFHTAQILHSHNTHTEELCCLAVSSDASFMVTGSVDTTAHVYSLQDGRLRSVLVGHTKAVGGVAVLPDCERCLTGSEDQTLRIWNTQHGECLALLYTDGPILACDISLNMTVLYGTKKGGVSTAFYQTNTCDCSNNPVLRKLQGIESPSTNTLTDSSVTSTNEHSTETETNALDAIDVDSQVPSNDNDQKSPESDIETEPEKNTTTLASEIPDYKMGEPDSMATVSYPNDLEVLPNDTEENEHRIFSGTQIHKENGGTGAILHEEQTEEISRGNQNKQKTQDAKSSACVIV